MTPFAKYLWSNVDFIRQRIKEQEAYLSHKRFWGISWRGRIAGRTRNQEVKKSAKAVLKRLEKRLTYLLTHGKNKTKPKVSKRKPKGSKGK